jgi:YHS domain-containing protein
MLTILISAALVAAPQAAPKPAVNTKCPVMGGVVDATAKNKVVVRGQEYRLCCGGCDKLLKESPDKYLEQDGSPKNAKNPKK